MNKIQARTRKTAGVSSHSHVAGGKLQQIRHCSQEVSIVFHLPATLPARLLLSVADVACGELVEPAYGGLATFTKPEAWRWAWLATHRCVVETLMALQGKVRPKFYWTALSGKKIPGQRRAGLPDKKTMDSKRAKLKRWADSCRLF